MGRVIDITGQCFGRLTVLGYAGLSYESMWYVRCDCGVEKVTGGKQMRNGKVVSCGCYHRENTARISSIYNVRHGAARRGKMLPEYYLWSGMLNRCYCKTCPSFVNYGGRGIDVCARWRGKHGFKHFFADMGTRPSAKHSLDRKNNDGNYTPGNCRWATSSEQAMNRRTANIIEANGERRHIEEWAVFLDISADTIRNRIRKGWTPARAVTTPPCVHGGRITKLKREGKYDGYHTFCPIAP